MFFVSRLLNTKIAMYELFIVRFQLLNEHNEIPSTMLQLLFKYD